MTTGLHFHKLDLHVHTPASRCYKNKAHTPEEIIQAAISSGLNGIAITDHNTAEWIDKIQASAMDKGLTVFPGVEISMSDGYHLVALFDPTVNQKDIESFLGAIDITPNEYGKTETICKKSVYEVVDIIHARNGLAILAHIDQTKGAFVELSSVKEDGKTYLPIQAFRLFNEAAYDAIECTVNRYPDGFDPNHKILRAPAYYQSSDNPDPSEPSRHSYEGIGNRYSWFKMDEINLEGLRQCFADHEVRIRRMEEYEETSYPRIISMKIGGAGFLRNQCFPFHEGLNSIIGGKGVGKSLAVELIRFAVGQVSQDQSILKDVASKVDKCLEKENTVEIVYQIADGTKYKIQRKFTGLDRNGTLNSRFECTNLSNGSQYQGDLAKMFPILAYSQTEVIKIAEDKSAQLQLIDQFIETSQFDRSISLLLDQLRINDAHLVDGIIAREHFDQLITRIKTLDEQIASINRALENPVFDEMKQVENKKSIFDEKSSELDGYGSLVRGWIAQLSAKKQHELPSDLLDDPDLSMAQSEVDHAKRATLDKLRELTTALDESHQRVEEVLDRWMPEYTRVEEHYKQVLKEYGGGKEQQEQERQRLVGQRNELEREARQSQDLVASLPKLMHERENLLNELEKAHFRFFEERNMKFQQLTELSGGKLQLTLQHAGDRTSFEDQLVELLKGSGPFALSTQERRQIAQKVMPRRFIELVLDRNVPRLAVEADITETVANKVIEKIWSIDNFKQVLELQYSVYPDDVPSIRFRKEGSQYAELNELSVGQKCTALLIIALCDGNMPIIIDQPEDALDIISVWEDIAKKLRRGKNSRQFILTTHNSSVAVASDSDQFIVLKAGAVQGRVVATGAIDRPEVRRAVIEHLEGGDEPYKLRSRKYNIR